MPADITGAFLHMDTRQGIAQQRISAEAALQPSSPIVAEWDAVQQRCYTATSMYLALTGDDPHAVQPLSEVQRQLLEATQSVDDFCGRHRIALERAAGELANVAAAADAAIAEAERIRQRLSGPDGRWLAYSSVREAEDRLQTAVHQLQSARHRVDPVATRQIAGQLAEAITGVTAALDAAPQQAERARRALASVQTRLAAARTRAGEIPPTLSALFREFHANSSADLWDNGRTSLVGLDRADALLQQAMTASREDRPEAALELITQARSAIGAAEELIDAPADRLALLRQLRNDTGSREREVRFRLRDAQRLAVDRGLVREWGTALDAQVPRIDRIVAALDVPTPDYWRYQRDLGDVGEFIAGIVTRIREGSGR